MASLSEILQNTNRKLFERRLHDDMFDDVVRMFGARPLEVDAVIAQAQASLGKNDRVTWFLRLWKIAFLDRLAKRNHDHAQAEYVERLVADYARRANISEREVHTRAWTVANDRELLTTLGHYLSLPIHSIQHHHFGYDDPEHLLSRFARAEKKWQSEAKGAFHDPEAELLIRFPNGLAWYNLNRSSCELEGGAMGHGGNHSRRNSDDTILSLRKTYERDGMVLHKPILTFVLDCNGMLGEMRGRFNEKPSQEYHNEIVALLKLPLVVGIKGGGHKPENNFSINDLDQEFRDELLDEKPELAGLYELYLEYGIEDERVQDLLEEKARDEGLHPDLMIMSNDGRTYTLKVWRNLAAFVSDIGDAVVEDLLEFLDDSDSHGVKHLDEDDIVSIIKSLSDREYARLLLSLGVRPLPMGHPQHEQAVALAARHMLNSEHYDTLLDAVSEVARESSDLRDRVAARVREYLKVGYTFTGTYQNVLVDRTDFDAKVSLQISTEDFISILTADPHNDLDDYVADLHDLRLVGTWDRIDWDKQAERRNEHELSCSKGYAAQKEDQLMLEIKNGTGFTFDHQRAAQVFAQKSGL